MNFGELNPDLMNHFKFWVTVADYYNQQRSRGTLVMYAQHTARFEVEALVKAFQKYSTDPQSKFMPLPGQLIDILEPQLDRDSKAKLIAGRVVEAVSKFGWINSQKAKEYIGPVGWSAVKAYGEWPYICENLGVNISMGQFQAQIRDHAKAQIESGAADYNSNQLEHSGGNEQLNDVVAKLASEKELQNG